MLTPTCLSRIMGPVDSKSPKNYLLSHYALHHKSAPYHSATNGLAENMVKNVKQCLDKQKGGSSCLSMLSDFLCTYRNVPHTTTGRTPVELLFGRALCTHISMVFPNTADRVKSYLKPPKTIQEPRQFKSGD